MALVHTTLVRNGIANYVVDLIDAGAGSGYFEFQTSGAAEAATVTFLATAFDVAAGGIAAAALPITSDPSAAGGIVDRFVIYDSNILEVFRGTVSVPAGGGDVELSSLNIGATDTVSMSSLTYEAPA